MSSPERSFWVEVKTGRSLPATRALHVPRGRHGRRRERERLHPPDDVRVAERAGRRAEEVHDKYNEAADTGQLEERELRIPGQQLAFAKPDADPAKRNSVLVTESLNFVLDENGDPKLLKADVRIPQVEELGTSAATTIRLFHEYVKNDFDGATGVFAEIAKPKLPMTTPTALDGMDEDTLGVDFSSDRPAASPPPTSGSRPSRARSGRSRVTPRTPSPTSSIRRSFFAGGSQLFGSFDLAQLLHRLSARTPRSCGPARAVKSS